MALISPEPWLRGALSNVHPLVMPVFFSFQQVREDLAHHLSGVTSKQIWSETPAGTLGFHLRHLAGSIDRISTYLIGSELGPGQLEALSEESQGEGNLDELIFAVHESMDAAEGRLRTLDPGQIFEARAVGRSRLPTTVIGLIVHLAEHTQRHLGQAISISKLVARTWGENLPS